MNNICLLLEVPEEPMVNFLNLYMQTRKKTGLYETLDSSYGRDDKDIITKGLALYQLAQLLKVGSLGMAYAILVVAV
jgi:hypothetical protein